MTNAAQFKGRTAIVTGASRGIGKAIALELGARGAKVVVNHRDSAALAAEVVAQIESKGGTAVACQADLAEREGAPALIDFTMKTYGRLDILVNNAGIAALKQLGEPGDWDAQDRVWAVNTYGVIATIRAAALVMAENGRIINIGSGSGSKAGMPAAADYCGSKAAVAGYTRGAAHDLAPRKITVNIIESGMMDSDMAHAMEEADKARILAAIPLSRFGDLSEISGLVCFLASPEAAYITGATLAIDGGLRA